MKKKIFIFVFIAIALIIIGIAFWFNKKSDTVKFVEQQMYLAGVENVKIIKEGKEIEVEYSPQNVEHEGEIVAQWGIILGILGKMYPSAEQYKIIQKLDNKIIGTIIVKSNDLQEYSEGKIDIYEFKNRIKFLGGEK